MRNTFEWLDSVEKQEVMDALNGNLSRIVENLGDLASKDGAYDAVHKVYNFPVKSGMTSEQAEQLRRELFKLQRDLLAAQNQATENKSLTPTMVSLDKLRHETLMILAQFWPLNGQNRKGKLICPITDETLENRVYIVMSNGCHYSLSAFEDAGASTPIPTKLGGSKYPITAHDLKEINQGNFTSRMASGFGMGAIFGAAAVLPAIYGVGLLEAGLLAVGVSAALAGGLAIAVAFVAPIALGIALGGLIGWAIYKNIDALKLDAVPAPASRRSLSSSTTTMDEGLGGNQNLNVIEHARNQTKASSLLVDDASSAEDELLDSADNADDRAAASILLDSSSDDEPAAMQRIFAETPPPSPRAGF